MKAVAWPSELHYALVHTSLLLSVHCDESLVRFEVTGFCYILGTGPSLQLLLDVLLLPCAMEILQFWIYRSGPEGEVLT